MSPINRFYVACLILMTGTAGPSGVAQADAPPAGLASDGRAAFPVVVSGEASPRVRAAADGLAG